MSFLNRNSGCAVGVMSMIINDSIEIDEKYVKQTLYYGIKNPLYISYEHKLGHKVLVSSSQGIISGKGNDYLIELNEPGFVIINVQVTDSSGNLTEKIAQAFKVKKMPVPIVGIKGVTAGTF